MDRKGDHFLPHSSPLTPCAFAPATQTAVSSRTGPPSLPASAPPCPTPPHSGHTALRPPYGLRHPRRLRHPRKLRRPGTRTSTTPAPPPVPDRFSRSSTAPPTAPATLPATHTASIAPDHTITPTPAAPPDFATDILSPPILLSPFLLPVPHLFFSFSTLYTTTFSILKHLGPTASSMPHIFGAATLPMIRRCCSSRPGTRPSTTPAPPPVPDRFSRSSTEPPPAPATLPSKSPHPDTRTQNSPTPQPAIILSTFAPNPINRSYKEL